MALNALALNNVYNLYLTTYAPKGTTPYDSHKKSELRHIYNSIVKQSKESPVYRLENPRESLSFAIGLKENARELNNTIASLGGLSQENILNKKTAYSSNENIASATYIGDSGSHVEVPTFDIAVCNLASPQVNTGNFLPSFKMTLPSDTYSFDLNINDMSYEFQFTIHPKDTNRDVQERLSRLINNSQIGIEASVVEDATSNTSLRLQSTATGVVLGRPQVFTVSDFNTSKRAGVVDYFGIDHVSSLSSNAHFTLNGVDRMAASNSFSVDKTYEITLNGVSPMGDDTAHIGLKTDLESMTENVKQLIGGYNSFLRVASTYIDAYPKTNRLLDDYTQITNSYKNNFESLGMDVLEDGSIDVSKRLLNNDSTSEDVEELYNSVKTFAQSVVFKTKQVSLNPMEYANRTMISYRNPYRSFADPYVTSAYSGMMFNSYC